jgi:hypothetical protein
MTDLAAQLWPALPLFFLSGCCLLLGGVIWLFVVRRTELVLGADPPMPPVVHAEFTIDPDLPVAPNFHRGEYPVVPHIPGATPQAGPVCPVCGGPFHPVCPSAPKGRNEETVALPVGKPALPPQFTALARFLGALDESTVELAVTVAEPDDDCPLTTREIPTLAVPLAVESPAWHEASERLGVTRELGSVMEKVRQA